MSQPKSAEDLEAQFADLEERFDEYAETGVAAGQEPDWDDWSGELGEILSPENVAAGMGYVRTLLETDSDFPDWLQEMVMTYLTQYTAKIKLHTRFNKKLGDYSLFGWESGTTAGPDWGDLNKAFWVRAKEEYLNAAKKIEARKAPADEAADLKLYQMTRDDRRSFVGNTMTAVRDIATKIGNVIFKPGWAPHRKSLKSEFLPRTGARKQRYDPEEIEGIEEFVNEVLDFEGGYDDLLLLLKTLKGDLMSDNVAFSAIASKPGFKKITHQAKSLLRNLEPVKKGLYSPVHQPEARTQADLKIMRGLPETAAERIFRTVAPDSQALVKKFWVTIRGAKAHRKPYQAGTAEKKILDNLTDPDINGLLALAFPDRAFDKETKKQRIDYLLGSNYITNFTEDMRHGTSVGDLIEMMFTDTPFRYKKDTRIAHTEQEIDLLYDAAPRADAGKEAVLMPPPPKRKPKPRGSQRMRPDLHPIFNEDNIHDINTAKMREYAERLLASLAVKQKVPEGKQTRRIFSENQLISRILGTKSNLRSGKALEMYGPFSMYTNKGLRRFSVHPEVNSESLLRDVFHSYGVVPMLYDRSDDSSFVGLKTDHDFGKFIDATHRHRDTSARGSNVFKIDYIAETLYGKKTFSTVPPMWAKHAPGYFRKVFQQEPISLMDFLNSDHVVSVMERDHTLAGKTRSERTTGAWKQHLDVNSPPHFPSEAEKKKWDAMSPSDRLRNKLHLHHQKLFHVADRAAANMLKLVAKTHGRSPRVRFTEEDLRERWKPDKQDHHGYSFSARPAPPSPSRSRSRAPPPRSPPRPQRAGSVIPGLSGAPVGQRIQPAQLARAQQKSTRDFLERVKQTKGDQYEKRKKSVIQEGLGHFVLAYHRQEATSPHDKKLFEEMSEAHPAIGEFITFLKADAKRQDAIYRNEMSKQTHSGTPDWDAKRFLRSHNRRYPEEVNYETDYTWALNYLGSPQDHIESEVPQPVLRKVLQREENKRISLLSPEREAEEKSTSQLLDELLAPAPAAADTKVMANIFDADAPEDPDAADADPLMSMVMEATKKRFAREAAAPAPDAPVPAAEPEEPKPRRKPARAPLVPLRKRKQPSEPDAPAKKKLRLRLRKPVVPPSPSPPRALRSPSPSPERPGVLLEDEKDPDPQPVVPVVPRPVAPIPYGPARGGGGLGVPMVVARRPDEDAMARARRHMERVQVRAQPTSTMWQSSGYHYTVGGDLMPPSTGRVHMVQMGLDADPTQHFIRELSADSNMGAKARRKGPFKNSSGRSMVMSRSSHTSIRKRGSSIELTLKRGTTEQELENVVGKMLSHARSTGVTWVHLVYGGRQYKVGRLKSVDMEKLKDRIRNLLLKHREVGILLVDDGVKGKMHRPGVHHVTRRNFNNSL